MVITNMSLTVVEDPATGTANCVAGCSVGLNPLEIASLEVPVHPGFRLSCVILGIDQGIDRTLFNYPRTVSFNDATDLLRLNQAFQATLSLAMLDEDPGAAADELRAEFTITDLSNGQSVIERSNLIERFFG